MADFPTFTDLFRVARDEVLTRNAQISRDAVEREGMDANILVASSAAVGDEVVGQISDLESGLFLGSAKKDKLDRYVFDRYQMTRKAAAASIGSVQLRTTTNVVSTFPVPVGTIFQTGTGQQFVSTEATIFPSGGVGPITLAVRSVLAGADQNAKAGTITSIVSTIAGAPSDLTVSNPLATVGGDDAEQDDQLRDRARRFYTTAQKGTLPAIEKAALDIPGIRTASAFDVLDAIGRPARVVQLVVADAFTEQFVDYTTIPPRYQQLSQAITTTVQDALVNVRAGGMFVQVVVANIIIQPVQLVLAFLAGADVNTAALEARAAIVNYMNALSPGKPFVVRDAQAKLKLVSGLSYTGNEIVSPAGDVVVKPLQAIRTSLGLVSAVSSQTDTPIITGLNPDAFVLANG